MPASLANTLPVHSRREHVRSNTFLMAMLISDTLSAPVRIKNISANGALLSGRELPAVGEQCRLRRGEISVSGRIVRVMDRTTAIKFARLIDVDQWIGAPQQLQSDVDRVVQDARHRYPIADSSHRISNLRPDRLAPSAVTLDELVDLADQLDRLADSLSDNPLIIAQYHTRLQVLDIASQRLRALGRP